MRVLIDDWDMHHAFYYINGAAWFVTILLGRKELMHERENVKREQLQLGKILFFNPH